MAYREEYKRLNDEQRRAVDTIQGPLLVVAGPGTGKTQLLTMRVGRILEQTDATAANILCLTFSESGEKAMRQRLEELLPGEGAKVPVYTFHSFGADVMARFPEYFYRGAPRRTADELKQYEILQAIFREFEPKHPLYGFREDRFTQLSASLIKIGEFKKAGLKPEDVRKIISHNEAFLQFASPLLNETIGGQIITKDMINHLPSLVAKLTKYREKPLNIPFIEPLSQLFIGSLKRALNLSLQAETRAATKPLTEWKNEWRDASVKHKWQFIDHSRHQKLLAVTEVYEAYQRALFEKQLYDYEDMIMEALTGFEQNEPLRNRLQEQYLYILVDEYQDTNQAQLRMVRALTDHPLNEGKPNVMVVGDDDQAIYKFQGADLSNMLEFARHYPDAPRIVLTRNYRSAQAILDVSRAVITQGRERLENVQEDISKQLVSTMPALNKKAVVEQTLASDLAAEYQWVAETVSKAIKGGVTSRHIAIIGRRHSQLLAVLPFLQQAGLRVEYERRENILESLHINRLSRLIELIDALQHQQTSEADQLMPEILSHDYWQIKDEVIWQLSFTAHDENKSWLELINKSKNQQIQTVVQVIKASLNAARKMEPLEAIIDILIGAPQPGHRQPLSPYYEYYFGNLDQSGTDGTYSDLLAHLITLRRHLRNFRPEKRLTLRDFLDFIRLHRERQIGIIDTHTPNLELEAVQVMTAHKAKGLEFEMVIILDSHENIWGNPERTPPRLIKYPANLLPLEPAGDTPDDHLRLFFVAMTRARYALYVPYYRYEDDGSQTRPLSFLELPAVSNKIKKRALNESSKEQIAAGLQTTWLTRHATALAKDQRLLKERLDNYAMSITHLNRFLNVQYAGPELFIAHDLLQFPHALGPLSAYGTAVHAAMAAGHHQMNKEGHLDSSQMIKVFEQSLQGKRLSPADEKKYLTKGKQLILQLVRHHADLFRRGLLSEKRFSSRNVNMNGIRLNGAIDAMEINGPTIHVIDYKTSPASTSWSLEDKTKSVRMHNYKRQLIFYKLLVENSLDPTFRGKSVKKGELIFLEAPSVSKKLIRLPYEITAGDVSRLKQLIQPVWQHVMDLNFPDISSYSKDLKGIIKFENDLIEGKV